MNARVLVFTGDGFTAVNARVIADPWSEAQLAHIERRQRQDPLSSAVIQALAEAQGYRADEAARKALTSDEYRVREHVLGLNKSIDDPTYLSLRSVYKGLTLSTWILMAMQEHALDLGIPKPIQELLTATGGNIVNLGADAYVFWAVDPTLEAVAYQTSTIVSQARQIDDLFQHVYVLPRCACPDHAPQLAVVTATPGDELMFETSGSTDNSTSTVRLHAPTHGRRIEYWSGRPSEFTFNGELSSFLTNAERETIRLRYTDGVPGVPTPPEHCVAFIREIEAASTRNAKRMLTRQEFAAYRTVLGLNRHIPRPPASPKQPDDSMRCHFLTMHATILAGELSLSLVARHSCRDPMSMPPSLREFIQVTGAETEALDSDLLDVIHQASISWEAFIHWPVAADKDEVIRTATAINAQYERLKMLCHVYTEF